MAADPRNILATLLLPAALLPPSEPPHTHRLVTVPSFSASDVFHASLAYNDHFLGVPGNTVMDTKVMSNGASHAKRPKLDPVAHVDDVESDESDDEQDRNGSGASDGDGTADSVVAVVADPAAAASDPEVDIVINNVCCSFNVHCHLDLRSIALRGINVEYHSDKGNVTMRLRRPYSTAMIWSSGKISCTGTNSEDDARVGARKIARALQKLGFKTRFRNFRVVNVLGTCTMPFGIKIAQFTEKHKSRASYEPELHPAVTYKVKEIKATLKIFSTGSITITAPSVNNIDLAVKHIYHLVYEFRKPKKEKL